MVGWAMKLYQSERHNHIAYSQKLAALQTFRAFVAETHNDPHAKAAVIAHAMATIFAPHDTGYVASSKPESSMPTEALIRAYTKAIDKAGNVAVSSLPAVHAPVTRERVS
jgi:hypothetical protein